MIIVGLVVIGLVLAWNAGIFDNLLNTDVDPADDVFPSDLKVTVNLNTGDELATTTTNANVSYYVFTANGDFLKSGTTSAGTDSFTVGIEKDYDLILYDDDASGSDYLPVEMSFSTSNEAEKTINVDLMKESAATISAVRDPVDLDTNVSVGLGQSVDFDVLVKATTANAALNKPIIVVDVNKTAVESVSISGASRVTCPDRLSEATDHQKWCFETNAVIKAKDGIKTYSGSLVMDGTTAAVDGSTAVVTVIDTGIYRESGYKTTGKDAFKYGAENPATNADVGAADSSTATLTFEI